MSTIWGIIGTGRVSELMAEAINRASDAQLIAVVSRSNERGRTFAEAHGIDTVHTTVEALAADSRVQAVHVASPNALHREHVEILAAAGKHVLCEKPMAPTITDSVAMIEACHSGGVVLGLGLQFRQHEGHRRMRDVIAAGTLGAGRFADASVTFDDSGTPDWYNDTAVSGRSGVLEMVGIHRVDLLRFITGAECTRVFAFAESRGGRPYFDQITATLKFDDGTDATVRFGFGLNRSGGPLSFLGEKASVVGIDTTAQWWSNTGGHVITNIAGEETIENFGEQDLYLAQVESFQRAISGDLSGIADGIDGLRAVEIAEAIYQSAELGRPVDVALTPVSQ